MSKDSPTITFEPEPVAEEVEETERTEVEPLRVDLEELVNFQAEGSDITRLHEAEEAAEIAVEYLKFELGLDMVGRIFSVEMVPDRYWKPTAEDIAKGRVPPNVPVLIFLGHERRFSPEGELLSERSAIFRVHSKAAMSFLISQPKGFEFRLRVLSKVKLPDLRERWQLSIKALRRPASK